MGRHSVMLSPDSVRRVTPPTTMTAMTRVEESKSQFPTAGGESTGRWVAGSVPFDEKKRGSKADLGRANDPGLGNSANEYSRVLRGAKGIKRVEEGAPSGVLWKHSRCSPRWPGKGTLVTVLRKAWGNRRVNIAIGFTITIMRRAQSGSSSSHWSTCPVPTLSQPRW